MALRYLSTLDAAAIGAAARHTLGTWGGSRGYESYCEAIDEQMTRARGDMRYAGVVDESGALVASLKRYRVRLASPHGPVEAVGIGAVFTPQPLRRAGHASALLRALLEDCLLYTSPSPRDS